MGRPPGRAPIYDTAVSKRVVVRLTPLQHRELQRVADETGTGVSSVVRELIDERVEDHRPFPSEHRDRRDLDAPPIVRLPRSDDDDDDRDDDA